MTRGLEGIKIVEIAQHIAAPAASGILADFGAQVIHVEHPVHGDGNRGYFAMNMGRSPVGPFHYVWEMINRNKRGMAVDIRSEDGQEIIHRLVAQSDVFLSNLRPYELEKYHFTYACLSQLNPRLVCANLNGLGQRGPERDAPGYDGPSYWARAGAPAMMSQSVREPPASPPGFGDHAVAQCFAGAIALALLVRERTGIGQEVDVSLFNSGIYAQAMDTQAALTTGRNPTESRRTERTNPLGNFYRTRDDRWILIGIPQAVRYWPTFCRAIEREDLEHDPRFDSMETRAAHCAALIAILDDVFAAKTLDEWTQRLRPFDLAAWAPVQTPLEVTQDAQAIANEYFADFDHPTHGKIKLVASPIKLRKTPATIRTPAPEFGQHTEEILLEAGYNWADIVALKDAQVIA
jgi:crotonobetainyl-CoA:carnitine CoA-transferase CaiB-like acyl-CoA transferase